MPKDPEQQKAERIERIKAHRFKPGQSGNPGGRPKKKPLTEELERRLQDPEVAGLVAEALIKTMRKGGMPGVVAFKEAADRVEGKVTEVIKHEGLEGLADRLQRARTRK